MCASVCLEEITDRLDALLQAVKSLDLCCAIQQGSPAIEEPPAPIERGIGDPPVGESWEEYTAYLCQALQRQVDLCDDAIDTLTDALGAIGLIGLDMLAAYLAPVAPPAALLLVLLAVLTSILEGELYDQWSGELELMAEDLICAGYLAYSPSSAKAAVDAVIDQHVDPLPNRALHKLLWSQTQINRIFRGEIEDYEAYDPDYCSVCEVPPLSEWHFDGSLEGWFLYEIYKDNSLEYDPQITHTADGTGSARLYGCRCWAGAHYARVQVNTSVEVVADMRIQIWHQKSGTANLPYILLLFDDETQYGEYVEPPPTQPNWDSAGYVIPGAHIGKRVVAIRISWQMSNSWVWFDDVRLYVE